MFAADRSEAVTPGNYVNHLWFLFCFFFRCKGMVCFLGVFIPDTNFSHFFYECLIHSKTKPHYLVNVVFYA